MKNSEKQVHVRKILEELYYTGSGRFGLPPTDKLFMQTSIRDVRKVGLDIQYVLGPQSTQVDVAIWIIGDEIRCLDAKMNQAIKSNDLGEIEKLDEAISDLRSWKKEVRKVIEKDMDGALSAEEICHKAGCSFGTRALADYWGRAMDKANKVSESAQECLEAMDRSEFDEAMGIAKEAASKEWGGEEWARVARELEVLAVSQEVSVGFTTTVFDEEESLSQPSL